MNLRANVWKWSVAGALVLTLLWVLWEEPSEQENIEQSAPIYTVTVQSVSPQTSSISVNAIGLTKARWPVDVIAAVSGRVVQLPEHTEPGNLLSKDTLLVAIQDTAYVSEFSAAQAKVEQARLELARYKHEQYVASKVGGKNKLSAFGRFEPHVAAAEAEVRASLAAEQFAKQQLQDTKINTPFDAVIMERTVTPGQWVNAGERLFALAASTELDVKVELSTTDWQRLDVLFKSGSNKTHIATVRAPDGSQWQASLRYISPSMDATTRQRSMMLRVSEPYKVKNSDLPLLPDQQVAVLFNGTELQNVVEAPATVLTEDGKVWSLADGKLLLEEVEILQELPEIVKYRYVNNPVEPRSLVRFPLSTMLEGQRAIAANDDVSGSVSESGQGS